MAARSAAWRVQVVGIAAAASLPVLGGMSWGTSCFFGCRDFSPLGTKLGALVVLGPALYALPLLAMKPGAWRALLSLVGLLAATFVVGLSWIFLEPVSLAGDLALAATGLCWVGYFASFGQPPLGLGAAAEPATTGTAEVMAQPLPRRLMVHPMRLRVAAAASFVVALAGWFGPWLYKHGCSTVCTGPSRPVYPFGAGAPSTGGHVLPWLGVAAAAMGLLWVALPQRARRFAVVAAALHVLCAVAYYGEVRVDVVDRTDGIGWGLLAAVLGCAASLLLTCLLALPKGAREAKPEA